MSKSQWEGICNSWAVVDECQSSTRARLNRHMSTMQISHSSNDRWIDRIMSETAKLKPNHQQ